MLRNHLFIIALIVGCSDKEATNRTTNASPSLEGTWDGECIKRDLLMGDYMRLSYAFSGEKIMSIQHEWKSKCKSQAIGAIRFLGTYQLIGGEMIIGFKSAFITPVGASISDLEQQCPGLSFKFGEKTDVSDCTAYSDFLTELSPFPYKLESDTLSMGSTEYTRSKFDQDVPE